MYVDENGIHTGTHVVVSQRGQGGCQRRHGAAVAIGLVYAAELGWTLGRIDEARVAEHRRIVEGYDLPTHLPDGADAEELMAVMSRDKKALDGLTFVLDGSSVPRADGCSVEVVPGVDPDPARSVLERVR